LTLIELLECRIDGTVPLVRLGCTCGSPALALYHGEGDQIIFCTNCGDITTREHLHNETPELDNAIDWKWENVADRNECPLINVSIPVNATVQGKSDADNQLLAGCVTKLSTDRCFLRLEDVPDEIAQRLQGQRSVRIELISESPPLTERTAWDLEEHLLPFGNHGPVYYKLKIRPRSRRRAGELKAFYQKACGLRFDWRILVLAGQEQASRLRRMLIECLPMARIEVVSQGMEFLRRQREKNFNLLILPPLPEFKPHFQRSAQAVDAMVPRAVALLPDRSTDAISEALRWGARDILYYDCTIEDLRHTLRRSLDHSTADATSPHKLPPKRRPSTGEKLPATGQPVEASASEEETVQLLIMASETHDPHSSNHLKRIAAYCAAITHCLGWSNERIALLATASKLHDVGKIGVPDDILRKTGALTEDERKTMQQHTRYGYRVLQTGGSPFLRLASMVALRHHERYDGKGYPDGLAADAIPVEAQVVSIADVFDALTTARPYKPAWSNDEAIAYLVENKAKMFDPDVVAAFLKSVSSIRKSQLAFLDDFRNVWTERRQHMRHPISHVPITMEVAMPEQTFRPFQLEGYLTNVSEGGLKLKLTNVSNDLFSMLVSTRRYGKLYCAQPEWAEINNVACEIVWIDYYAVPDPNAMLLGLSFHKSRPNLISIIHNLADTIVDQTQNRLKQAISAAG
jgi:HD-GYP domain-containing protein (c-di-GMP phosphodiesterase class II)